MPVPVDPKQLEQLSHPAQENPRTERIPRSLSVSQYKILPLFTLIYALYSCVLQKLVADVYETLPVTFNLDERYTCILHG